MNLDGKFIVLFCKYTYCIHLFGYVSDKLLKTESFFSKAAAVRFQLAGAQFIRKLSMF